MQFYKVDELCPYDVFKYTEDRMTVHILYLNILGIWSVFGCEMFYNYSISVFLDLH